MAMPYVVNCEGPDCGAGMWMTPIRKVNGERTWHPFNVRGDLVPHELAPYTLEQCVDKFPEWVSHFETCPNAGQFRRHRRVKPEAEGQGSLFERGTE